MALDDAKDMQFTKADRINQLNDIDKVLRYFGYRHPCNRLISTGYYKAVTIGWLGR